MYDVLCVGNAIVDLIAPASEAWLENSKLEKGGMTLVDSNQSADFLKLVQETFIELGGSVANTSACLASLGAKVAYIGKLGDDELGRHYRSGLKALNVDFVIENDDTEFATANCLAIVTPDGERTMVTYLGACTKLSPSDIDEETVSKAKVILVEGYLFDSPSSHAAVTKILDVARSHEIDVAITLSDANCVKRNFEAFKDVVDHPCCRFIIANEGEMAAYLGVDDFDKISDECSKIEALCVVTRSSKGAVIVDGDNVISIPAQKINKLVDVVGAGDAFAGGFLYGISVGLSHKEAAVLGSKCAAVIIQEIGSKPTKPLRELVLNSISNEAPIL